MRILFRKISDERHTLAIERAPGALDARLAIGFWGSLAAGKTLADMNDRTGASMKDSPEIGAIEQVVGALHGSTKGIPAGELVGGITRFAASLGVTMPDRLTEAFVVAVQERMRRLQGHWRATPFGGVMELGWPG